VADYHRSSHEQKSEFWRGIDSDAQKSVFCFVLIPSVEWTNDEAVAVYAAICRLSKEEQQMFLELAVASLMASSAPAISNNIGTALDGKPLSIAGTALDGKPPSTSIPFNPHEFFSNMLLTTTASKQLLEDEKHCWIKQVELWKHWAQFVPHPYKTVICPKPPQDVIERIKKEKSAKQKAATRKRKSRLR
jgi:hypothetical protein